MTVTNATGASATPTPEAAPADDTKLAALKAMIDEVNLRLDDLCAQIIRAASPDNLPTARLDQIEDALITQAAVIGEIQPHFAKSDITGPQMALRERMAPIKARRQEG